MFGYDHLEGTLEPGRDDLVQLQFAGKRTSLHRKDRKNSAAVAKLHQLENQAGAFDFEHNVPEDRDEAAGKRPRSAGGHAYHNFSNGRIAGHRDLMAHTLYLFEYADTMLKHDRAFIRKADAATVAGEQSLMQLDFELADLATDFGLGYPQRNRSPGKTAELGDLDEVGTIRRMKTIKT